MLSAIQRGEEDVDKMRERVDNFFFALVSSLSPTRDRTGFDSISAPLYFCHDTRHLVPVERVVDASVDVEHFVFLVFSGGILGGLVFQSNCMKRRLFST